jgi:hypothetical protein
MSALFEFIDDHRRDCEYRRAAIAGLAYECEHGHDLCPICDPCTCAPGEPPLLSPMTRGIGTADRAIGTRDTTPTRVGSRAGRH